MYGILSTTIKKPPIGNNFFMTCSASGFETNSANIKLPKIPLPKFTGQSPIEWVSFWDQFTAAVVENQSLHDVQKLAYLKSCLLGPTAESIPGYTLTEDNYSLVVEFLRKRFSKKRLIIQAHVEETIDLSKFDTMENNEVKSFLDILGSNLRSVSLSEFKVNFSHLF